MHSNFFSPIRLRMSERRRMEGVVGVHEILSIFTFKPNTHSLHQYFHSRRAIFQNDKAWLKPAYLTKCPKNASPRNVQWYMAVIRYYNQWNMYCWCTGGNANSNPICWTVKIVAMHTNLSSQCFQQFSVQHLFRRDDAIFPTRLSPREFNRTLH